MNTRPEDGNSHGPCWYNRPRAGRTGLFDQPSGTEHAVLYLRHPAGTHRTGQTPRPARGIRKVHAKNRARELRAATAPDDTRVIKVIFADSVLEAEEKLQEHREAPILKEWEK
jgi:hypothetical protein